MKTLIQENSAYKLYAEITIPLAPKNIKHLKLTSTFTGSRIPNEERKVFEAFLNQEEYDNLANFLQQYKC